MITIITTISIKEGLMEKAINILKEIIPQLREDHPGILDYIPYIIKGKEFENKIIIYEKYTDEEAYMKHLGDIGEIMEDFLRLVKEEMDLKRLIPLI